MTTKVPPTKILSKKFSKKVTGSHLLYGFTINDVITISMWYIASLLVILNI